MSILKASASSAKITRDAKMVFDIFVESLQGGIPGQGYIVKFIRGESVSGESSVVRANASGLAEFKYHAQFACTLQRKNDSAYKKKEFRLHVEENPSGYVVADVIYDLSSNVSQEVFPNKKLMTKSANGLARLLFSISGVSEIDQMTQKAFSQAALKMSASASVDPNANSSNPVPRALSQKGESFSGIRREQSMSNGRNDDDDDDDQARSDMVMERSQSMQQQRSQSRREAPPPPADDDDDDLVNSAIQSSREAKEPSSGGTRKKFTPRSAEQQASSQPPSKTNRSEQSQNSFADDNDEEFSAAFSKKTNVKEGPPRNRPPATKPDSESISIRSASLERQQSQEKAAADLKVQQDAAAARKKQDGEAAATLKAAQKLKDAQNARLEAARLKQQQENEAAKQKEAEAAAALKAKHEAEQEMYQRRQKRQEASPTQSTTRNPSDDQVFLYINEIIASVSAAQTRDTASGKQRNEFLPHAKTSSTIPRASLLILHCLRRWRGSQRTSFLHDLLCVIFVDVIPTTRLSGQWINTLVHVLYDALAQPADNEDEDYDPLSEDASQAVADRFLSLISLVEDGPSSKNTYLVRGSRQDALFRLLPVEQPNCACLPPASTVILAVALDEALRQLADVASRSLMKDIARFCFPPKSPPTKNTENGYHFVPSSSGVAGGGSNHPTDDPAFSVVLHSLDQFFGALYGDDFAAESVKSAAPLLRVTSVELFRIVFRNIASHLVNNSWAAPEGANKASEATFRVTTARSALHFKLAISMLESWLQEHQLFTAVRSELLPCRQFCDVAILQKKLLLNPECREEATSSLPPALVLAFLHQFLPNPRDYVVDEVPKNVITHFEQQVDALRKRKTRNEAPSALPRLDTPPISSFGFLAFIASLLPADDDDMDEGKAANNRKSLRKSLNAAAKQLKQADKQQYYNKRALDWDYDHAELKEKFERESIFTNYVAANVDDGSQPGEDSELARSRVALRLAALSLPDEEVLDGFKAI